jgi:hypothetical protein
MNDLVRAIREFLYRDLAFILGGTLVIASIAYSLRHWLPDLPASDLRNPPTWSLFVFPALAYVVGYAVQDIGGVIGITFTGYFGNSPNKVCCWLYSRFVGANWSEIRAPDEVVIGRLDLPQPIVRTLERILSLKVIGMCVGVCLLLRSLFLLGRGIYMRFFVVPASAEPEAVLLGILFFWFGVSLICLGWIKAMQQMQLLNSIAQGNFPTLPRQPNG